MSDNNYVGNISTIVKLVGMTIAGWIISVLASKGFNLGVDAAVLGEVIGAFIGLAIGYIDAKNPNSFSWLGNSADTESECSCVGEEDGA